MPAPDDVQVPALNIDSGGLVDHLLAEAERAGAVRVDPGPVTRIADGGDGYVVVCDGGTVHARAVVAALGAGNPRVVDGHPVAWEKRQLFVLDLPVGDDRAGLPHTIAAVRDGHAYVFVKRFDGGLRVVVGQEDIVEDDDAGGPVDHFGELLDAGVAEHFPFLRSATVERILWGPDWPGKVPHVEEHAPGLVSVNCGSAVRACIAGGRAAADAVMGALV